jgi:hypothetical protein
MFRAQAEDRFVMSDDITYWSDVRNARASNLGKLDYRCKVLIFRIDGCWKGVLLEKMVRFLVTSV